MQDLTYTALNEFLVGAFNEILRIEGRVLCRGPFQNLSIREVHVIEAVCQAHTQGDSRPSVIAPLLGITAGSLTTAVGPLIKKGYLQRKRGEKDKRSLLLCPTEKGLEINRIHATFHHDMVSSVIQALSNEELQALVKALDTIQQYFSEKSMEGKED